MMSQRSKREMIVAIRPRYLKANKAEKAQILDEFVATTGYHRKYAIRVLKHGPPPKGLKKAGSPAKSIEAKWSRSWNRSGRSVGGSVPNACIPFSPRWSSCSSAVMNSVCQPETQTLLLGMSRATIDRCLKKARFTAASAWPLHHQTRSIAQTGHPDPHLYPLGGRASRLSGNRSGGALRLNYRGHLSQYAHHHRFSHRLERVPGAGQQNPAGRLPGHSDHCGSDLPFPLLGVDSDNGSEFINETLLRYCQAEQITFTRSRPYQKNDQAHVEQKNWSVVRHTIGYDRLETPEELALLHSIYADLRLYINFFQPCSNWWAKNALTAKQCGRMIRPPPRIGGYWPWTPCPWRSKPD